jgi:two-component system, NarL family, sensor histidine kinase BarA
MLGDADRIQQVLQNLLSNAIKFVPKGNGLIKVKAEIISSEETPFLLISVHDNGPGISEADISKLFQAFSRLEANQKLNMKGSGLGLHICKQICTSLGGNIKIDSELRSFTRVSFWVPIKRFAQADVDEILSARLASMPNEPEINTKTGLTFKSFLNNWECFGQWK